MLYSTQLPELSHNAITFLTHNYYSKHFLKISWAPKLTQSIYVSTIELFVKVLRPTRHKTGYFGDVLPSQRLG